MRHRDRYPAPPHFFVKKKDPRSRSRTSDLEISIASSYSLPLYQLSYTRTVLANISKMFFDESSREERTPHTPRTPNSFGFDHINRNAPVLIRTPKLTRFEPAQYWGGGPPGNSVVLNPFFCYFFCFFWFLFFDQTKKAPRPGIEPGFPA